MANLFTGHKDEWKALADLDYFSAFVKAYIPFNAWMNVDYTTLDTDRKKINAIKKDPNTFRNKICALLDSESQEGSNFRNQLGELHGLLEHNHIYNQDNRITFTSVNIGKNTTNVEQDNYNCHHFFVKVVSENEVISIVQSTITKKEKLKKTQSKYDINELKSMDEFLNLSNTNQFKLIDCYQRVNPFVMKNFTPTFPREVETKNPKKRSELEKPYYDCGNYKFIKEPENLAKGLIEILYNLRCSLFHGEIVPNKDANQVYGAAYRILYALIQSL